MFFSISRLILRNSKLFALEVVDLWFLVRLNMDPKNIPLKNSIYFFSVLKFDTKIEAVAKTKLNIFSLTAIKYNLHHERGKNLE